MAIATLVFCFQIIFGKTIPNFQYLKKLCHAHSNSRKPPY